MSSALSILFFRCLPKIVLPAVFVAFTLPRISSAQSSTRPTPLPGITSITFADSTYTFNAVGVRYSYSLREPEPGRGTLRALNVVSANGSSFWPSNFGGIKAFLAGSERAPWDDRQWRVVRHRLVSARSEGDTAVTVTWEMVAQDDSCRYAFRFSLSGQTLVIQFDGDESRKATGIGFNNANTLTNGDMRVISIPCLTLMNVLFNPTSNLFATLFVDWEISNASGIRAWNDGSSKTTGYYSQMVEYEPLTNGRRNRVAETAYLSASADIANVLPNIVPPPGTPVAPLRDTLLSRMIISYFNPFPQLNWPYRPTGVSYLRDLDSIYNVRDVAFLVKNWNQGQFDHDYPRTWPPDEFLDPGSCYGVSFTGGGKAGLSALASNLKRKGYLFGLHENYVDYYDSAIHHPDPSPVPLSHGLLSDGGHAEAFKNVYCQPFQRSFLLKPSSAARVAAAFEAQKIRPGLGSNAPDWCYLDVCSSVNPSGPLVSQYLDRSPNPRRSYVDFDTALGTDAGKFIATVKAYRSLAGAVRRTYGGPVQGEGGNHFLYAGYFDGFEGRLTTGDGSVFGYNAPLIVAFSQKIRDKSAVHGAGHIQDFFRTYDAGMTDAQVKIYLATELAYGYGGLVTTATTNLVDHSLKQARWEQEYLLPVQRMYANAEPVSVTYFDATNTEFPAYAYLRNHYRSFDVIEDSLNFMGRIRVVYDNGLEVWVNRTRSVWDLGVGTVGSASGWYCYNASVGGSDTVLTSGAQPAGNHFILPKENGWVCYSPSRPSIPGP